MSIPKKKIGLIAKSISFNLFSIIYSVELEQKINDNLLCEVIVSANDIKDKDLILKSTAFTKENKEVIFTPSNVTPLFYQNLYEGTNERFKGEYQFEKDSIYKVGEIVGYVII